MLFTKSGYCKISSSFFPLFCLKMRNKDQDFLFLTHLRSPLPLISLHFSVLLSIFLSSYTITTALRNQNKAQKRSKKFVKTQILSYFVKVLDIFQCYHLTGNRFMPEIIKSNQVRPYRDSNSDCWIQSPEC